ALGGMIHLAWLGKRGFVELGELLVRRTAYARERLAQGGGGGLLPRAPGGRGVGVSLDAAGRPGPDRWSAGGRGAGLPPRRAHPEHENGLLVAITERRSRADIDRLADVLGRAVADLRGAKVAEGVA